MQAIKQLVDALSEGEEHKDAVMAVQKVAAKKRGTEPVQVKRDKVKILRGRWENMGKKLKQEEVTVAQMKEQLRTHGEAIKERKAKVATKKTELDAAVADLNEARKRGHGQGDYPEAGPMQGGTQGQAVTPQMAQPVPGPTLGEAQRGSSQRSEEEITASTALAIGGRGGLKEATSRRGDKSRRPDGYRQRVVSTGRVAIPTFVLSMWCAAQGIGEGVRV